MTEKNGDLKWKTDNAIDEAYRRGYEDAKKEFIGMSAKQIQIKYHDDFATALEKMYEYEERQKRYDIEKVYDPIEGAERYTFVPKKERQTDEIKVGDEVKVYDDCIGIVTRHAPQARTCYVMYRDGSCGEEELTDCKKTGNHSMSLDKWLEQMRKESHE